uniref:Exocyst complex component 7 n=1 Tax=Oryctolagus cuniculus TaxID=9986 RepID=G1TWT5_RABIT
MIPPQEASARRREIEDKLKQEEETLSFIRDSLEKSDQLTKNMVSILSSFESRLMRLENSIIPMHKQMENLQRLQENVEKKLSCLDHVISYYHVLELQEDMGLEHLPESALQDVTRISRWLAEYGRNQDFMNVYYQIRSSQLDRSVKGLKEHFRKSSCSSGVPYSPAHLSETNAYIHCVSAFVKLAQSEYQLLIGIIPEHHQKKTFDSLIQDALDGLMLEGENIVSAARKAIIRHDFSTVLTVFPILRHLKQTKPEFDEVLQGTAASTKSKLPDLITSMETVGAKALEDFADNIKNDPDKEYNMPKDGTVHELRSNAILFLQQLLDFQETAGAMLASQETSSSATSYSSEFSKRLLSTYVCKVLGNLQLNLLSKSKVHEDPALSAIFLHNNYNYILKSLEKSELMQLVAVTQKTAERSYREHIQQQIQIYQRSWIKVIDYIADKNLPVLQPGIKLRDKERQMIKERFKGFNDGLEELCKIQKPWATPDTEQRDKICQAQKDMVKETYGVFLHRYGSVPFTKNIEKYIKYRVDQVGDMIDRLFDTSA